MFRGRHLHIALEVMLASALTGCAGTGLPMLYDPRPESQKLVEANKYDPYPDPTVGGDITGARPRGFINPRPDPDASKLQTHGPWPEVSPPASGYPPAQVVYPAGPVYGPAVYPPATAAPGYPPPGAVYLPPSTATPPMGTPSAISPPSTSGALPLGSIAPMPGTFNAPAPVAYGTAIKTAP
ncbi:MAG TPA: hypothetical protein VFE46_16750 [Pirellulales bacterium]|jgi:hypothetical protein|nr:hypothetical protein [Pirellulales bacterium]